MGGFKFWGQNRSWNTIVDDDDDDATCPEQHTTPF
jgi:hypothetical protein